MRIEINCPLKLRSEDAALLDNHAFLNQFNMLERQLHRLAEELKTSGLEAYHHFCVDLLLEIASAEFESYMPRVEARFAELSRLVARLALRHPEHHESLESLLETLQVSRASIADYIRGDRYEWRWIPRKDFRKQVIEFLSATARASRGRFQFRYGGGAASPGIYNIDINVSAPGESIYAPPILQETIRDLVGNARKYSNPGTCIRIVLEQNADLSLSLKVSDEGIGIPESEMERVVEYGYRATNVRDRRTMGGGFGLTKAYHLCRKLDGRFFIESRLGEGTTIEMQVGLPVAVASRRGFEPLLPG